MTRRLYRTKWRSHSPNQRSCACAPITAQVHRGDIITSSVKPGSIIGYFTALSLRINKVETAYFYPIDGVLFRSPLENRATPKDGRQRRRDLRAGFAGVPSSIHAGA
jgi:hypothetical protein